jgi:sugar lactone lactonase YvrE
MGFRLPTTGDACGEGAVWHASHKAVYWNDINRFLIPRFTPADQFVRTWSLDEPVCALAVTDQPDVMVVVLASSVILWEPATDVRPVLNVTTCTFGGPDRKTLYVTTAKSATPPGDRLAGSLYAIPTKVAGQPENQFQVQSAR